MSPFKIIDRCAAIEKQEGGGFDLKSKKRSSVAIHQYRRRGFMTIRTKKYDGSVSN